MRKTLGLAALALGLGATVVPVSPASANHEVCYLAARTYDQADRKAFDLLPDVVWYCPHH